MKYALILSIILLAGISFAQSVDTAIVTTDKTSVDLLVAKAAGDRNGIPVFTAANGELTQELRDSITATGAKNVVIVGGPAVVSVNTETGLKASGYNVIRLWGIERTGTAIEVAKHFWLAGSRCAVLAEDTKNPEADTQDGLLASTLASNLECPFIPMPKGEVPAEVLALFSDLNITDIHHIGVLSSGPKSILAKYKLKELRDTDVDAEVLEYYTNGTRVMIIAARSWNDVAVASSNPAAGSVVKFVTDVSQVSAIADFITENGIKDVRIVGIPSLAQQIDDALRAEGITPTKVTGERASEVAKKLWEVHKERWEELRDKNAERRDDQKEKIKARLLKLLNDTESEVDAETIEADELAVNGDVSVIKERLSVARQRLSAIKQDILGGDVALAQRKLQEIRDYRTEKWQSRDKIMWKWQERVDNEEGGNSKLRSMHESALAAVENLLPRIQEKCNSTDIQRIVEEAKSLRTSIKTESDAGNQEMVSELLKQQEILVGNAKRLSSICERSEKLPEVASKVAERNVERAMKIRETGEMRKDVVKRIATDTAQAKTFMIEGDDVSLSPATIEVSKGDTVRITFKVRSERVSFGGLDFRSDYFTTNKISPGSTGNVEFTADKSFTFVSYWPGSNVQKASGQVVVK